MKKQTNISILKELVNNNVMERAELRTRVVLVFLVVLGPAIEFGINIECNAFAVVARLFPGSFPCRMPFKCFSFWGRMLRA